MQSVPIHLEFDITPQPDESTCGPACLHAVYRHYGDRGALQAMIDETGTLPGGGTLAVILGRHALARGYGAAIYTCNLQMFDPTWFAPNGPDLRQKLLEQAAAHEDAKLSFATDQYIRFIEEGGEVYMEDLGIDLLGRLLASGTPVIAGLSATWLYRIARERPDDNQPDDINGESTGHFVVLHGLDSEQRLVRVADPYPNHPLSDLHHYTADAIRVISSILLGVMTYDAKILVITPQSQMKVGSE